MRRLLYSPWLSIVVRISLGLIFVYSSLSKLDDPPGFAKMIWNYKLLPMPLINPLAIILPWLEVFAGVVLIAGVFRRGLALVTCCMLSIFFAALAINLVRGNPIDCGCFSISSVEKSKEELLAEMRLDLLRDSGLLLMALQVLMTPVTWRREAALQEPLDHPA